MCVKSLATSHPMRVLSVMSSRFRVLLCALRRALRHLIIALNILCRWITPSRAIPSSVRVFAIRAMPCMRRKTRAKPLWVHREVLRLKALMPDSGCRSVSDTFNRLHAAKHHMTVGKTWVSDFLRAHRYEIEDLRRQMKRRVPGLVPRNQVWGIDLTGKRDQAGIVHPVLGILDHGTRRALALDALGCKNTWTLLGCLFIAIGRFGKPRSIRSDNESMFKNRRWRIVLTLAGIRHQLTDPGCPWMNGRVERFFGTLKEKLNRIDVVSRESLSDCLGDFAVWYNHVRPHRHLHGQTPVEAWNGIDPYADAPKRVSLFIAWGGLLTGFYIRR